MDSAPTVNGADEFEATVTFYLCREASLVDVDGDPDPDGTCAIGGTQIFNAKDVTTSPSNVSDAAGLTAAEVLLAPTSSGELEGAGVPAASDSASSRLRCHASAADSDNHGERRCDARQPDLRHDLADRERLISLGPMASARVARSTQPTCRRQRDDQCHRVPAWTTRLAPRRQSGIRRRLARNHHRSGIAPPMVAGSVTQFTPTAVGQYTFVASYSGDKPNTLGAGPSACDDANEQVTVTGAAALVTRQRWLPNDANKSPRPRTTLAGMSFTLSTTMVPAASVGVHPSTRRPSTSHRARVLPTTRGFQRATPHST